MEDYKFKKEVLKELNSPMPKKKWDGKTPFDKGIAVIERVTGEKTHALCACKDGEHVNIIKDFTYIPFKKILEVYPSLPYMEDDMNNMDIEDEDSKEAMEGLLKEKEDIVNDNKEPEDMGGEWGFDFIHDKEEALAFLKEKTPKGRLPQQEEVIKAKLKAMYHDQQVEKNKKNSK